MFLTPANERDFHAALDAHLKRRALALEDLFAVCYLNQYLPEPRF